MHVLELLALLLIVWIASTLFPEISGHPAIQGSVLLILSGATKFARHSDTVPLPDYVNKSDSFINP